MTLKSISFPLASLATSLSYIKEDLLKIAEWCCQKSQQDKNSFVKKSSTTSTVNDHDKPYKSTYLVIAYERKTNCIVRAEFSLERKL